MHRLTHSLLALCLLLPSSLPAQEAQDPIRAGYDLYYSGDMTAAYRHFLKLSQQDPENLAAAYGLLSSLYARDRMEDSLSGEFGRRAADLVKRAKARRERDPDDSEALFYLAQTLGLRGGYHFERRENFYRAAQDAAQSKKYSEEYVKRYPGHADACIALGLYNYYADLAPAFLKFVRYFLLIPGGNRKLGLEQLERAAREARMWSPQARMELVRIYTWTEGRIEEGLRMAEELRKKYPDNAELAFRLARLASGPVLEDPDRAAALYSRMLKRWKLGSSLYADAIHYQSVLGLAEADAQRWRLPEAVERVSAALREGGRKPEWATPKLLLARARYRALLNDSGAAADLRRIRESIYWGKWKGEAAALLRWFVARRKSGAAERFVQLIPANKLAAQGRFAEAREHYTSLQRTEPRNLQVRYRLARLDFLEGRLAAAREEFLGIRRSARGDTPAWLIAGALLHLARLHDLRGERKQAVKLYEAIVDDYEKQPEALAARIGLLTPFRPVQLTRR